MMKLLCFKKYSKNVYKILINETMNIISKNLDIYRIFRMIFLIEANKNNFEYNPKFIKMSNDIFNKLSEIK